MSATINTRQKSIAGEFLKKTAEYITGASGQYINEVMPITTSTISGARRSLQEFQSTFTNTTSALLPKMRQLRLQMGFRTLSRWFLQKEDELDDSGDLDSSLEFDTATDASSEDIAQAQITELGKNANQISKTVVETSHKMVEAQLSATANLLTAVDRQTAVISSGFDTANETLSKILEVLTKNTATLIETNLAKDTEHNVGTGKFNFSEYKKMVKGNIMNSELGMLGSMIPLVMEMGPQAFLDPQSLIKMGLGMGMKKFAPNIEKSAKALDEAIGEVIMGSLIRLGENKYDFGFKGTVARMFGIDATRQQADTSRSSLELKAVPFDTVAKEALTQAIPGYLRDILVALGGADKVYDYRSRSFRTQGAIHRDFHNVGADTGLINFAGSNVKKYIGDDETSSLMFDLLINQLGSMDTKTLREGALKNKEAVKAIVKESMNGISFKGKSASTRNRVMEELANQIVNMDDMARTELVNQVASTTINRNIRMQQYVADADSKGVDLSGAKDTTKSAAKAIARQRGAVVEGDESTIRGAKSPTETLIEGSNYTNKALYEIYRTLNTGINVYLRGSGINKKGYKKKSPFENRSNVLDAPVEYTPKNISDSDSGEDTVSSTLGGKLDDPLKDGKNPDGTDMSTGDRIKARGKNLAGAFFSGDARRIKDSFKLILNDVVDIAGSQLKKGVSKINESFGNVGGYLKHKLFGQGYSYTGTDGKPRVIKENKKGGMFGFVQDHFKDMFTGAGSKAKDWFKNVSGYFNYSSGTAKGEDATVETKRKRLLATSVGALGGGLLAGPLGILVGSLAGNALSFSAGNIGSKISEMLFGKKDKKGKRSGGLFGRIGQTIFSPIKTEISKTFSHFGNILRKKILGPLSDLGVAIKERISNAASNTFGKVFGWIGKKLMGGLNKILDVAKFPIKLAGMVARGAASVIGGGIGLGVGGLTNIIAGKKGMAAVEANRARRTKLDEEADEAAAERDKNQAQIDKSIARNRKKSGARDIDNYFSEERDYDAESALTGEKATDIALKDIAESSRVTAAVLTGEKKKKGKKSEAANGFAAAAMTSTIIASTQDNTMDDTEGKITTDITSENKKDHPNPNTIESKVNAFIKYKQKKNEDVGEKKEGILSTFFNKVLGFLGPLGSLVKFGWNNPLIVGIGSILGLTEGKTLLGRIIGRSDDESYFDAMKSWWNEESLLGKGIRNLGEFLESIADITVPVVNSFTNGLNSVMGVIGGVIKKIPGAENIYIPPFPTIESDGLFGGLKASILGGLYFKAGSAIASGVGAVASIVGAGINLVRGAGLPIPGTGLPVSGGGGANRPPSGTPVSGGGGANRPPSGTPVSTKTPPVRTASIGGTVLGMAAAGAVTWWNTGRMQDAAVNFSSKVFNRNNEVHGVTETSGGANINIGYGGWYRPVAQTLSAIAAVAGVGLAVAGGLGALAATVVGIAIGLVAGIGFFGIRGALISIERIVNKGRAIRSNSSKIELLLSNSKAPKFNNQLRYAYYGTRVAPVLGKNQDTLYEDPDGDIIIPYLEKIKTFYNNKDDKTGLTSVGGEVYMADLLDDMAQQGVPVAVYVTRSDSNEANTSGDHINYGYAPPPANSGGKTRVFYEHVIQNNSQVLADLQEKYPTYVNDLGTLEKIYKESCLQRSHGLTLLTANTTSGFNFNAITELFRNEYYHIAMGALLYVNWTWSSSEYSWIDNYDNEIRDAIQKGLTIKEQTAKLQQSSGNTYIRTKSGWFSKSHYDSKDDEFKTSNPEIERKENVFGKFNEGQQTLDTTKMVRIKTNLPDNNTETRVMTREEFDKQRASGHLKDEDIANVIDYEDTTPETSSVRTTQSLDEVSSSIQDPMEAMEVMYKRGDLYKYPPADDEEDRKHLDENPVYGIKHEDGKDVLIYVFDNKKKKGERFNYVDKHQLDDFRAFDESKDLGIDETSGINYLEDGSIIRRENYDMDLLKANAMEEREKFQPKYFSRDHMWPNKRDHVFPISELYDHLDESYKKEFQRMLDESQSGNELYEDDSKNTAELSLLADKKKTEELASRIKEEHWKQIREMMSPTFNKTYGELEDESDTISARKIYIRDTYGGTGGPSEDPIPSSVALPIPEAVDPKERHPGLYTSTAQMEKSADPHVPVSEESEEVKASDSDVGISPYIGGKFKVNSPYGPRVDPITKVPGKMHSGIDLKGLGSDKIGAVAEGEIDNVVHNHSSYGNYVEYKIPGTNLSFLNAHLSSIAPGLKKGDPVEPGSEIGIEGSTGRSTGPHLHFEVKEGGKAIDPSSILGVSGRGTYNGSSSYGSSSSTTSSDKGVFEELLEALSSAGLKFLNLFGGGLFKGSDEDDESSISSGKYNYTGDTSGSKGIVDGPVELLTNAEVRSIPGIGRGPATVLDLLSGAEYNIFWGGPPEDSHTDYTPLTPEDTQIKKQVANDGQRGGWMNFTPRPCILKIAGRLLAIGTHNYAHGSRMGGNPGPEMPNLPNKIVNGHWPRGGHFCMYYKDSRGNRDPNSDNGRAHRDAAYEAYVRGNELFGNRSKMGLSKGEDNAAIAYNFFRERGLSPEAASAVVGTLIKETGDIDPRKRQYGGGPGRGIFQWEEWPNDPRGKGARFTNLKEFARSRGTNWDDLETQLEFAWQEMQTKDLNKRMKGEISPKNMTKKGARPYPGGFDEWKVSGDLDRASRVFDAAFTRSGDKIENGRIQKRVELCQKTYNRFQKEAEENAREEEIKAKELTATLSDINMQSSEDMDSDPTVEHPTLDSYISNPPSGLRFDVNSGNFVNEDDPNDVYTYNSQKGNFYNIKDPDDVWQGEAGGIGPISTDVIVTSRASSTAGFHELQGFQGLPSHIKLKPYTGESPFAISDPEERQRYLDQYSEDVHEKIYGRFKKPSESMDGSGGPDFNLGNIFSGASLGDPQFLKNTITSAVKDPHGFAQQLQSKYSSGQSADNTSFYQLPNMKSDQDGVNVSEIIQNFETGNLEDLLRTVIAELQDIKGNTKDIKGNTGVSNSFLNSINNKDTTDNGLRTAINALGNYQPQKLLSNDRGNARSIQAMIKP